ncbi:hypothetical protein C1H76_7494 [Elsinoe australis]|uniref:Uncharacterized protein n=1 Tax=Elsinoe australis TaxID=40998 RepID=A0A4U7AUI6_9PEZI|nr:hypothetical protein C1H76_7494 [Elsinoe australis]
MTTTAPTNSSSFDLKTRGSNLNATLSAGPSHTTARAPSPSPRKRRHHSPDPLQRVDTSTLSTFSTSPASSSESDTLWTRTVRNPIAFVSFLFSLSYVDWRERAWRVAQRGQSGGLAESLWGWLSVWNWGEARPWQDESDSTWGVGGADGAGEERRGEGGAGRVGGGTAMKGEAEYGRQGSWPIRKKLRKMAKLEVGDALEIRGVFTALVLAGLVGVVIGMWLVGRWAWRWMG